LEALWELIFWYAMDLILLFFEQSSLMGADFSFFSFVSDTASAPGSRYSYLV